MKTIELTENYWDCECDEDYIHYTHFESVCPKCQARREDQPNSRINEVVKWITNDHHIGGRTSTPPNKFIPDGEPL